MKISNVRAKGKILERLIRDRLKEEFNFSDDDIRTTISSENGEDIKLSTRARKIFPFKIECKNRSRIVVYNWYNQCKEHEGEAEPLLVIKQNRSKPLVILDLDFLIKLIKKEI